MYTCFRCEKEFHGKPFVIGKIHSNKKIVFMKLCRKCKTPTAKGICKLAHSSSWRSKRHYKYLLGKFEAIYIREDTFVEYKKALAYRKGK